jgi:hypothetical protein
MPRPYDADDFMQVIGHDHIFSQLDVGEAHSHTLPFIFCQQTDIV